MKIGGFTPFVKAPATTLKPSTDTGLVQDNITISTPAPSWPAPAGPALEMPQSQAPSAPLPSAPAEPAPAPQATPQPAPHLPAPFQAPAPQAKAEKWMDSDWNLGPGANSMPKNEFPLSNEDFWKFPAPDSPPLHSKTLILDDQAAYFVSGKEPLSKKPEIDPLMAQFAELGNKGLESKPGSPSEVGAQNLAYANAPDHPATGWMAAQMMNMFGGGMMGGFMGGGMLGLGMPGMGMGMAALAGTMMTNGYAKAADNPYNPPTGSPQSSVTNFAQQAQEAQLKILEGLKATQAAQTATGLQETSGVQAASGAKATSATQATSAVSRPNVATCAGLTKAEVVAGVKESLKSRGVDRAHFAVDEKLFPSLEKLDLNPVDFFAARACWQGVSTKRRAVLEKVLDEFPTLPKDQKNWQAAVKAAEAKGTEVKDSDRVFIGYFIENRKAMKSLFRATLPSGFDGKTAVCYRGQQPSSQWGPHSTKPLGCYSIDPGVSEAWSTNNLKRFKVKLNDVWSTYTTLQNNNREERELTVYSRGGVRRGEPVQDVAAAKTEFQERYKSDKLAKGLEQVAYGDYYYLKS